MASHRIEHNVLAPKAYKLHQIRIKESFSTDFNGNCWRFILVVSGFIWYVGFK